MTMAVKQTKPGSNAIERRDRLDVVLNEVSQMLQDEPPRTEKRTALLYARGDLRNARDSLHYIAACLDKDQASG